MTVRDFLGLDERYDRWLVRALQAVLVGVIAVGLYRKSPSVIVNGGVSLAITFVPGLLERNYRLPIDSGVVLWITAAVCVHAIGALGPYRWFGWYDQVAHTLSATIVAGVGYAGARAVDLHSDDIEIPSTYMFGFVIVFILAAGVLWEILEFAVGFASQVITGTEALAQYGIDDIALDLTFNAIGGVIVATLDTPQLRRVARAIAGRASE